MTEHEIWELVVLSQANIASLLGLYLTAASGYLVVSYLVGNKLTTMQTSLITGLFIVFGVITTFAVNVNLIRAGFLMGFTDSTYRPPLSPVVPIMPLVVTPFLFVGVIGCLKFMWDVRHPKSE